MIYYSITIIIFIKFPHCNIPQLVEKHPFTLHMRSLSFWLLYLRLTLIFTRARRLFLAFHEVGMHGSCFGHRNRLISLRRQITRTFLKCIVGNVRFFHEQAFHVCSAQQSHSGWTLLIERPPHQLRFFCDLARGNAQRD